LAVQLEIKGRFKKIRVAISGIEEMKERERQRTEGDRVKER